MKTVYIAYGSNLNKQQMAHRCPTAKVLGTAELEDYKLLFKGSPYSSFLTIEKAEGHVVPVLLWQLEPRDERSLDIYEGYPNHYRKEYLKLKFKGKTIKAMVYIMNNGEIGAPTQAYAYTVAQGYLDCNFSLDCLNEALIESLNTKV